VALYTECGLEHAPREKTVPESKRKIVNSRSERTKHKQPELLRVFAREEMISSERNGPEFYT
jgi:hypothetical protein